MASQDPTIVKLDGRGLSFEREIPFEEGVDLIEQFEGADAHGDTVEVTVRGDGLQFERDVPEGALPDLFEVVLEATGVTTQKTDAFVDSLTEKQAAYLRGLLSEGGDWVASQDLRAEMESELGGSVSPQELGPLRRGFRNDAVEHFGEEIDEQEWRETQNVYRLTEKYQHQFAFLAE